MVFEEMIAYHCGPALAGIKPSNLIACRQAEIPDWREQVAELNNRLNESGLFFEVLCVCQRRALLLVYRKNKLFKALTQPEVQTFLESFGYPKTTDIAILLGILKQRLCEQNDFPHEIGAFLGYPLHDLFGFLHDEETTCLYNGYWKVYDRVEEAKETFRRYDICRRKIWDKIASGATLEGLFGTAS